jgi:hypothetical protein
LRGLPIALVIVLASRLAAAGGSKVVGVTPPAGPAEMPAAPADGSPIARIAAIAGAALPVAQALAAPVVRSAADLNALAEAARARFAKVDGANVPPLAMLTVEPVAQTTSSGFGWRDDPFRHNRRYHPGTDFRARSGTPVLAAGDGKVIYAARMHGYGNVIFIDHGGGVVTRYGHLRRIQIKRGAQVTAGQQIGLVGMTGRATGPHLHFEVRLDGRPVDPIEAMAIAQLERDTPIVGHVAMYALVPAIQREVGEALPPRSRSTHVVTSSHRHHHHHPRPERRGHSKRAKPVS